MSSTKRKFFETFDEFLEEFKKVAKDGGWQLSGHSQKIRGKHGCCPITFLCNPKYPRMANDVGSALEEIFDYDMFSPYSDPRAKLVCMITEAADNSPSGREFWDQRKKLLEACGLTDSYNLALQASQKGQLLP